MQFLKKSVAPGYVENFGPGGIAPDLSPLFSSLGPRARLTCETYQVWIWSCLSNSNIQNGIVVSWSCSKSSPAIGIGMSRRLPTEIPFNVPVTYTDYGYSFCKLKLFRSELDTLTGGQPIARILTHTKSLFLLLLLFRLIIVSYC